MCQELKDRIIMLWNNGKGENMLNIGVIGFGRRMEAIVGKLLATGEVKPTIYKVLPITEAEAAHDILYRGENIGKVVLKVW